MIQDQLFIDSQLIEFQLIVLFVSSKVFHVRSVTQGDVIRADSKDIPRIFQLLYAGEGEARKTDEQGNTLDVSLMKNDDKQGALTHKGHEFLNISYHMPTTCEICPKPMWHMFRPPPALECRRTFYENILLFFYVGGDKV